MRRLLVVLLLVLASPAGAIDLLDRVILREKPIGKDEYGRMRYTVVASLSPMKYFTAPLMMQYIPPSGGGSGSITIGTTAISGGATTEILYNLAGVVSSDAGFTRSGVNGTTTISNGTGAVSPLVVNDNVTPVFTIADGGAITTGSGVAINMSGSGSGLSFGSTNGGLLLRTALTPDAPQISTGSLANSFHVYEAADFSFDFTNGKCGTSACTNPSLIIHSPDQVTTEYTQIQNDATGAGKINTDLSELTLGGSKNNITEASAQAIVRITLPTSGVYGALVTYTVSDDNGTDFVVRNGSIQVQGANKAGTNTCTILSTRDQETEDGSSAAVTGGALTLTYTWTNVVSTVNCDLSLNAASSAGANTYDIKYTVILTGSSGITVTPQ